MTTPGLPSPISDEMKSAGFLVDNELSASMKRCGLKAAALRSGFSKRSGHEAPLILFALLIWPLLLLRSVKMFCEKSLEGFVSACDDTLYDLLKRENLDWRGLQWSAAKKTIRDNHLESETIAVLVADDTVKCRRGKKMEGVSYHFDHLQSRTVKGQQVLTLGFACESGFVPLDEQIYVSKKGVKGLNREFEDGRSHAARRWSESAKSKIDILCDMLGRAKRHGIKAGFFAADSWFGCRKVIRKTLDCGLTPVLRMKRGNLKYWLDDYEYTADELCATFVKGRMKKLKGLPRKALMVPVVLDLSEDEKKPELRIVNLLFVRGIDPDQGKKDWALFLCTDLGMSAEEILEVYVLRWGIEVYFKEAKQNLGLLREQTRSFASHTASIHLTALRYLLLLNAVLKRGCMGFGETRDDISTKLQALSFARLLWEIFRAVIGGASEKLKIRFGEAVIDKILALIDCEVNEFLEKALQLDTDYMTAEAQALKTGGF